MSRGKDICKTLKEIRRRIAEENGIELEIPECTFKGECRGTCPMCESELRYLDSQLRSRRYAGRTVKIAGIAAGTLALLSPFMLSCSSETRNKESKNRDSFEVSKERNESPEIVEDVITHDEPESDVTSTFEDSESVNLATMLLGEIASEDETSLDDYNIVEALEGEVPNDCQTESKPIDPNAIHKFSGHIQEVIMKGSIISTEPIGGVRVVNLRTNQIVSSDQFGGFEIDLKLGDALRITAYGFETQEHSIIDLNQNMFIFTHSKEIKEMMNNSPE